jgi:hypothetical protein
MCAGEGIVFIRDLIVIQVFHNSVKHFKNLQQIDYAKYRSILRPIERESLRVCFKEKFAHIVALIFR